MKTIDCSGLHCPKPLIETKRAIDSSIPGEILKVIVDNDTSLHNLRKYLADNGINPSYQNEMGKHSLTFSIIETTKISSKPETYCESMPNPKPSGNYIVVLDSDTMGNGSKELGELLAKGFLSALCEIDKLPLEIICYNSGVNLAKRGLPTAANLLKLNNMGVKITLCGTCIDFFGIKSEIEVGEISNMYYIAGRLTLGLNVIKPF